MVPVISVIMPVRNLELYVLDAISTSKYREQIMYRDQIQLRQLSCFKIRPSVDEIIMHQSLLNDYPVPEKKILLAEKWCNKLLAKNDKLKIYHQEYLYQFFEDRMINALKQSF